MTQDRLNDEYFEWIYNLVYTDRYYEDGGLSYRKLLMQLHNIEFTYILPLDENRAIEGVNFRYRFGYEKGYPDDLIRRYLDTRPCSVLEMMMALALYVEETIMDDPKFGNRTGQWFWNMIVSLGLGQMTDVHYDRDSVDYVITRFLNRDYAPNGEGGLFTIHNTPYDLRDVEIWNQCMWYLNEFLDI